MSAGGEGVNGSHCYALWLLWGSLTDWVENKPDETALAEAKMRRAAAEWLEVADDGLRWRRFFDRWLYDEMGYERKSPQTIYVELVDEDVAVWRPVEADVEAGGVFRLPPTAPPPSSGNSHQGAGCAANGASCPPALPWSRPSSRTDLGRRFARDGQQLTLRWDDARGRCGRQQGLCAK